MRSPTLCAGSLPEKWAYALTRWKNVTLQQICISPDAHAAGEGQEAAARHAVRKELGPDYDVATHFTPRYNPWDQRLCLVPNSDLFAAIRSGKASVVTDLIDSFTETGIRLKSGKELDADIIVTATGLNLVVLGEMQFSVDGAPVDFGKTWTYKGMMYSGRAEPGLDIRLHQCLVDAAGRSDLRICLPADQSHGRQAASVR